MLSRKGGDARFPCFVGLEEGMANLSGTIKKGGEGYKKGGQKSVLP